MTIAGALRCRSVPAQSSPRALLGELIRITLRGICFHDGVNCPVPAFHITVGIFGNSRPISLERISDLARDLPQTSPTALKIKRVLAIVEIEVPFFFRYVADHMINPRPDKFDPDNASLEALAAQNMISQDGVVIAVPRTIFQKTFGGLNERDIDVRKIPKKIGKMPRG